MKKSKFPGIKSIQELAEFWDTHDLSDFEDELEEVTGSVFARSHAIRVPLKSRDVKAVESLAKANGVSASDLVRGWVLQKLPRKSVSRRTRR